MKVCLGNIEFEIENEEEFKNLGHQFNENEEVNIIGLENEPSITILINKSHAFLIFQRFTEDHGFHSLNENLNLLGFKEFILRNGQADEYPQKYLIDRKRGLDAFFYFLETRMMDPRIDWISQAIGTI